MIFKKYKIHKFVIFNTFKEVNDYCYAIAKFEKVSRDVDT